LLSTRELESTLTQINPDPEENVPLLAPLLDIPSRADLSALFTEGFDTRDLKEAKALLEELAS
jgi:hypothetical protein